MNNKQLILAAIVLLALLIVSYSVMKKDSSTWKRGNTVEKQPLLKDFDVNKIAKIAIKSASEKLTLAIKDGKWEVVDKAGYPADFKKISSLILGIRDLKVAQFPRLLKSQFASIKLVEPENGNPDSATSVTLFNADGKAVVSLLLGDIHSPKKKDSKMMMFSRNQPDGRYVMLKGTEQPALVTNPLMNANPNASKWLDKSFLEIGKPLSVAMRGPKHELKWEIMRKAVGEPWTLQGAKKNEKVKPMVMRDATSAFDKVSFDDVLASSTPAKTTGLDAADAVTIKTADGFTYLVKLSKKNGKIYAKLAVAANLAKKRKSGQAEKPAEAKKLDAAFAANLAKLEKKLKNEEFYQNWIYVLPIYSMNKVLKKRTDFLNTPKKKQMKVNKQHRK